MIEATAHAIDRFIERVAPVTREEAARALSNRRIDAAASFGAHYVRLGSGHRVVIQDGFVVTVLPTHCKRGYVIKQMVGRD